jgi:ribosomal protein L34E
MIRLKMRIVSIFHTKDTSTMCCAATTCEREFSVPPKKERRFLRLSESTKKKASAYGGNWEADKALEKLCRTYWWPSSTKAVNRSSARATKRFPSSRCCIKCRFPTAASVVLNERIRTAVTSPPSLGRLVRPLQILVPEDSFHQFIRR